MVEELSDAIGTASALTEDLRERLAFQARQARESAELRKGIIERFPDAVVVVSEAGSIVEVNPQAEYLFGYHHSELIGQPVEILLPERLREKHVAHRHSFTEDPHIRAMGTDLTLLARRKNGAEIPVEIMLSPIVTVAGSYVISVIRRKKPANKSGTIGAEKPLRP